MRARRLRGAATVLGTTALLLAAACYVGCEAVPDIRFVTDATADAPRSDSGDGAVADSSDGSALDAADASPSCSAPSPAAGALCCGTVWCIGDCSKTNCDDCAQKARSGVCVADDVCCGKTANVLCKRQCP